MAIEKIGTGVSGYTGMNTATGAGAGSREAVSVKIEETVSESSIKTENISETKERVTEVTGNVEKAAGESVKKQLDNETLKKKISEINSKLNNNTECHYGIHEETQRVTLKIVDKDTQEVVREVPAEKTLEMIAKVWELTGLLVDERR